MVAYDAATVGRTGELAVVDSLRGDGWTIERWDTKAPGATDIEARKGGSGILVQVKTAIAANQPAGLSSDEERNLKSRATRLGRRAFLARVELDSYGQRTMSIGYTELT